MANVTQSLFPAFGDMLSPSLEQTYAKQFELASRPGDSMQKVSGLISGAGEQFRQGVSGLFGQQPVEFAQRDKLRAIAMGLRQQGVDVTTPEGMLQLAQSLEQFPEYAEASLRLRQQAAMMVQQRQQQELANRLTEAKIGTEAAQAGKYEAEAEKALRVDDNPNLEKIDLNDKVIYVDKRTGSIVQEYQKGLTPEQKRKQAQGSDEEKAGYIGKTGAYRNSFGEVFSATEMAKQRAGFDSAESILKDINKIDGTTIRQAEGFFDVTEPGITQKIASQVSPKTVEAQTKIAAIELQKRLEALPPGSASDADMRQAARGFPGFGDAQALKNWVNETKEKLEFSLAKQNERYGFNRKIKATAPVEFGKQKAKEQKPSSDVPAGVDPAVWAVMTPEEKALWK